MIRLEGSLPYQTLIANWSIDGYWLFIQKTGDILRPHICTVPELKTLFDAEKHQFAYLTLKTKGDTFDYLERIQLEQIVYFGTVKDTPATIKTLVVTNH